MAVAAAAHKIESSEFFDSAVIDSLSGIMSESAIRALLVDMERDVRLRLDRLAELHIASGSLPMIAQDAHDLKSMGGNFGLIQMAERAGVVERAARSGCVDTVRTGMSPLLSVGGHSLNALTARPEFIGGGAQ